ncbi:MAG: hypothetical protein M1827_003693 [Pycnora praestabilis]|nr:MAG: hypothetical protein M1827_003693 [Pycnora praestabilis]
MADEPGQPPALTQLALAEQSIVGATAQNVTPFDVSGGTDAEGKPLPVDYNRLVEEYGTKKIDHALLVRFEHVTGHKPHRFMRRGLVFSHRELDLILNRHERGQPFFLYTGRGPSSDSMHIGHTVPFEFTKWLQEVFDVPLVIMLTDDEKYIFNQGLELDDVQKFTRQNAKDIISIGFDVKKTFIFSDLEFVGGPFYHNIVKISKHISLNQAQHTFGFNNSDNIGKHHFCAVQSASSFATSFPAIFGTDQKKASSIPCLIPCAIDQDAYFRITRDVAPRLKYPKPALIHSTFLPALQGAGTKMSASKDHTSIFMKDTPKQIKDKINKHAFSGGQDTKELQEELGGDPEVDISFQYLKFMLDDDEELENIRVAYRTGKMLTGTLKQKIIKVLQDYVKGFQERKGKTTDEVVDEFMRPRKLDFRGNPNPVQPAAQNV